MDVARFDPAANPPPEGGYTHGLSLHGHERLLFISGQTPERPDGGLPEGFEAQCEQAWQNVLAVVEEAGMGVENLVKVTTFLGDRGNAGLNTEVRGRFLGEHRPALTVLIAGIFDPAWLVEIEAIAAA